MNGLIPIALGAPKQDYVEVSPPSSFLHVEDFESPEKLAEKLHAIDKDDDVLKKYHAWRDKYRVVKYAAPDWCSLCKALHDAHGKPPGKFRELNSYWFGNRGDTCRKPKSW